MILQLSIHRGFLENTCIDNGAKFQVEWGRGHCGWRAEGQAMLSDAIFALESF